MRSFQKLSDAAPDMAVREFLLTVERLLRSVQRGQEVRDDFQHARHLLEAIPQDSDQYALSSNRLRNAHRYLMSKERGAARYELQLLAANLRNFRAQQVDSRRDAGKPRI
jgi:hypothetical protein